MIARVLIFKHLNNPRIPIHRQGLESNQLNHPATLFKLSSGVTPDEAGPNRSDVCGFREGVNLLDVFYYDGRGVNEYGYDDQDGQGTHGKNPCRSDI